MVERNLSAVAPSGYHLVADDITSPGGTAGQHYKREFVPTTALMPPIIPTFYRTRWTGSDSVHWRIIRIPVFPLALGKIRKRGKSMGTAHIGKFDLQEPCGKPRVAKYRRKLPLESRHVLRVRQIYLSPTFRSLSSSLTGNGSGTGCG